VPDGADAGGAMYVKADVADSAAKRLTGVQTHPNPSRGILGAGVPRDGPLRRNCGGDGIPGPLEHNQDGVPWVSISCLLPLANASRMSRWWSARTSAKR